MTASRSSRIQHALTNTAHPQKCSRSSRLRAEAQEYSMRSRIPHTLMNTAHAHEYSRSSRPRAEAREYGRSSRQRAEARDSEQRLTNTARSGRREARPPSALSASPQPVPLATSGDGDLQTHLRRTVGHSACMVKAAALTRCADAPPRTFS